MLFAFAVALCAFGACAVAYAHPLHFPGWHDLLGQTTGGSFGGSSWGSGGGSSGSSGGGSSGSSGGGLADALFELVFQLLLQLLWQAFVWCLTQYPAPTLAVIVTIVVFAWGARAQVGAPREPIADGAAPIRFTITRRGEAGPTPVLVVSRCVGRSITSRGGARWSRARRARARRRGPR